MLGRLLKTLRLFSKMTIVDMGDALGIGSQDIADIESEVIQPTENILMLYANYFGLRLENLVAFSEDKLPGETDADLVVRHAMTKVTLNIAEWIGKFARF